MKTKSLHGGDIEFLNLLIFFLEKNQNTFTIGNTWKYFCYKYGNIFVSKKFGVCYSEIHCDKILEKIHLIILTTYFKNYKLSVYTKI